ncbi:hypothetical protein EKK58_06110 [Candidatus Dependentiae bacterium]|nr:MAG: hypothetical protein EKK58_06110 [Candidatus Dependentiae bacterium]
MKEKAFDTLNNPKGKLICVDMDGTLCEGEYWHVGGEADPLPNQEMIDIVNDLYIRGGHIIIWTARTPDAYAFTQNWAIKHGVKHHGISMQRKSGADLYIDDKCLNVDDVIKNSFPQ